MVSPRWLALIALLALLTCLRGQVSAGADANGDSAPAEQAEEEKSTPDDSTERSAYDKVMVIPIEGVIIPESSALRAFVDGPVVTDKEVKDALEKARRDGARLVVLEIDSPGGVVETCNNICTALLACDVPTVALVTVKAISGGSMVATACNEIIMVKGSRIGDCEPHAINMELPDYMREKVESDIRGRMRANAQTNGLPDKLLEAMVTKSIKLFLVEYADGKKEFLKDEELRIKEAQIESGESQQSIAHRELIVDERRLLTLTAQEALTYGLAKKVVDSVGQFYDGRAISHSDRFFVKRVVEAAEPLPTKLVMILVLCLIVGISGVIVEANVPGFGVPGVVGIIGFSAFFAILGLHGRAEHWEIALFVIGLILLLVEIFVLPGFGVCGIGGLLCIGASFVLSYLPSFTSEIWKQDWRDVLDRMLTHFGIAGAGAIVVGWLLAKYCHRIPIVRRLMLLRALPSGAEVMAQAAASEAGEYPHETEYTHSEAELKGKEGVAATVLRPAGKMRTDDGETFDVVSDGSMVPEGTRVRIAEVHGPRILVVPIPPPAPPADGDSTTA